MLDKETEESTETTRPGGGGGGGAIVTTSRVRVLLSYMRVLRIIVGRRNS